MDDEENTGAGEAGMGEHFTFAREEREHNRRIEALRLASGLSRNIDDVVIAAKKFDAFLEDG